MNENIKFEPRLVKTNNVVSARPGTNRAAVQAKKIATEKLDFFYQKSRGIVLSVWRNKKLISCAVLVYVFVFAHANCSFSHDTAH